MNYYELCSQDMLQVLDNHRDGQNFMDPPPKQ